MTRLTLIPILLLCACSGAPSYADTQPAQCLVSAGYEDTGNGATFLRGDTRVTLAEFDGVVQPVGDDDLAAYVAAGCR